VSFDRLFEGTAYDPNMGQSPAAFAAGNNFERNAAGPTGSYAPLFAALAAVGLDVGEGGVEAFVTGDDQRRSRRTRTRIDKMLSGDLSVVLIAQAVLEFDFAGRTAMIRPDAVVIVPVDGKLVLVELKGFRMRDGHYPAKKMAAALEQDAVYQIALRRIVADVGHDPDRVSDRAVIVCAARRGMQPVATLHDNGDKVRTLATRLNNAESRLAALPDPAALLAGIDSNSPAADRVAAFQNLAATYGTSYRPSCLQKCGAAQFCREAAHDDPARLGATRLLRRAGSITTAVDWANGATPVDPDLLPVADRLVEVAQLVADARADVGLPPLPSPRGPRRRRAAS
jgi:hypothetical protein